ncbi:fumarylacetoacetate hydrolase family protein [uncultured Jannaschia sp.]|uniref:fumarylacetoacetate hydrolase family protein n=1 Tax=uncultured Jannaschia sp. TaxID=293347 RepID=UPI00261FA5E1|nr:fumarylacetoacetate hydrolase family protein [uncultured Jannaschia sp.]
MRLATIMTEGTARSAIVLEDGSYLDVVAAGAGDLASVQAIVEGGADALAALRDLADAAEKGDSAGARHAAADATLLAPIPSPRKNVFCVGRNYAEHVAEGNRAQNIDLALPEHPVFFTKPSTAVIGSGAPVPIFPHVSTAIDYEVELAVVIGTAGRDIPRDRAYDHVFGYTILNDVTARDVQRRHGGQYFKGKGLDGSCPIGPWIVTADEVPDPANLAITTRVNGELRQDGRTGSMIFDIPTLISSLSEGMTLEPGDILATGTPEGVGYAMTPPRFLADGDVVSCEIEGIGRLENPIRTA